MSDERKGGSDWLPPGAAAPRPSHDFAACEYQREMPRVHTPQVNLEAPTHPKVSLLKIICWALVIALMSLYPTLFVICLAILVIATLIIIYIAVVDSITSALKKLF